MFSVGLVVLALAGACLCQQPQQKSGQYQSPQQAVSQASFQTGSAAVPPSQTRLEDIERDSSLPAGVFGQKSQQPGGKPSTAGPAAAVVPAQQQPYSAPQQLPYQAQPQQPAVTQFVYPQQQYYVQPYQAPQQQQQQQYLAQQPFQMAFDYNGVQYMIINPQMYTAANQAPYQQQYYVPATAVAQPSAVPQYVTKQSAAPQEYKQQSQSATTAQGSQEYKQQPQSATTAQGPQQYKQQPQFAAPATAQSPQEYKQQQQFAEDFSKQQYVMPTFQFVQQPVGGPVDFAYVTRHPSAAQFKTAAVQPQFQYSAVPQQYQQQPQQFYYTVPSAAGAPVPAAAAAAPVSGEQPRVQQSAKSQFSSGVKSTTPFPLKATSDFAYKFESSPQPQQSAPSGPAGAYSTLRFSA